MNAPARGASSRVLLQKLRDVLASREGGQERLDKIVRVIAATMETEVCSIYLRRDARTLELCATEGLNAEAVHRTRMRFGQGLVGRVAETGRPVNTANAPRTQGFRYMPETGEEIYSGFLGVPIQRLGEALGVLVVQNKAERAFSDDDLHGLEVIAMVIAEMTEAGAFTGTAGASVVTPHQGPVFFKGVQGQEGVAEGPVLLHDPHIVIAEPVSDDPEAELARLHVALHKLRGEVDRMLDDDAVEETGEAAEVLQTYAMFARDRSWIARIEQGINEGLAAEVAVEKEQSSIRQRMARMSDPYLRERFHDLDDLSNRLLRLLSGQRSEKGGVPHGAILVARNIGPAELLDYGRRLGGVVLEEGAVSSHAVIVARALAIPLVLQCGRVAREALDGDTILVDGDEGLVHLRPEDSVRTAFREKIAMREEAQQKYAELRDLPASALCGSIVSLHMNAGLMADLPSLTGSGAEGVGLYRTELQFLVRSKVPRRAEQAALYSRILDAGKGKRVVFRTLDIGSDKVLPYMRPADEPNPALGWRAIRLGLDRRGVMRMQLQSLIRGAKGRPLSVMFPMIAQFEEFKAARKMVLDEIERERKLGHVLPSNVEVGAMLETPSLAFAPEAFFELVDFISIGGNDLKQFFFAADRENERVRRRYDTLNVSYLSFIGQIVGRCAEHQTPVSFCGEDAGRPVEAACFAAMGLRALSMRPASIGPVKHLLRQVDLDEIRTVIDYARTSGAQSVRPSVEGFLRERGLI
ncbi:phosphoenolpyruvate--protein phosphotransferase [Pontivivens ytuae]|uniref:phosphoenolpyruvate--protein phosphotransferase n=1 Tax=Pontivivens ytuae TaxID=2789856 RepID=A0A7S9LU27_9RHOB|nr:phosphoenolpyruvate--protein phosphotransferase [Pontivivens ytuae]QPH55337.1 phosphoenolpyruvate--protein phosphotransferase [Pontivivens ytuae]